MDAQLKKIQIIPAQFDDEGEIKKEESATITLEVPLNTQGQREALLKLMEILDTEWIEAEISNRQQRMKIAAG